MPRTSLAHARARRDPEVGECQNSAVHHLEVWFSKISTRSNYMCGQRRGLLKRIFISVASRARGNTCKRRSPQNMWCFSVLRCVAKCESEIAKTDTCKRRTGPPQNMWCFSVLFCVAKRESEIAKTGRRRITKDGIGRSHRDLAIRVPQAPLGGPRKTPPPKGNAKEGSRGAEASYEKRCDEK